MKKYIGTKQLKAKPMTLGEYNEYRGWKQPENENPNAEGYLVEYQDGGKPNDERHNGYISWSPKDVFEKAYQVSETPLDRMRIESDDLFKKCNGLHNFIGSETFNKIDHVTKGLLLAQYSAMTSYDQLLFARANRMKSGNGRIVGVNFGVAIEFLKSGLAIRRSGWNGKGLFVIKQVPAHIGSDVVPKMQSLPEYAKDLIMQAKGFVGYTSQCLIYNTDTGRADSWVPSISDVFAEDWELVLA